MLSELLRLLRTPILLLCQVSARESLKNIRARNFVYLRCKINMNHLKICVDIFELSEHRRALRLPIFVDMSGECKGKPGEHPGKAAAGPHRADGGGPTSCRG